MEMRRIQKIILILTALLVFLTGCAAMPQSIPVEGEEADQLAADAAPIAEGLFQGLNARDYAAFSRDFDTTMKKSLNEKGFSEMYTVFDEKVGAFQSLEAEKVERIENLFVVSYKAQFEKESDVAVRLTLRDGDPLQVAGLWFDSPKLREE